MHTYIYIYIYIYIYVNICNIHKIEQGAKQIVTVREPALTKVKIRISSQLIPFYMHTRLADGARTG